MMFRFTVDMDRKGEMLRRIAQSRSSSFKFMAASLS